MPTQKNDSHAIAALRRGLLAWYEANRRDLPWRRSRDPYAIWVSEIMLQQTRVAVVVDRFQAFLARFPTLLSLALATEQEVLALWSGLGYYRRARMMQKAAQLVAGRNQGSLPATADELRALPGIGAYTAAAIASIAYGERVPVVDGNVERVLCRVAGWEAGSRSGATALKRKIDALALRLLDPQRPGDFNQALMELGATVCLPRNPQCVACPLHSACKTRGEHKTRPRPPMLRRQVAHALAVRTGRRTALEREVLLAQRPATETIMPGLWELPLLRDSEIPEDKPLMTLRHSIMQVNYHVRIRAVTEDSVESMTVAGGLRRWVPLSEAAGMALTGLARKILSRAPNCCPQLRRATFTPRRAYPE
ncbi:MAG: A/G-specific adenine glycosylase [Terracidiphilus sp.]